MKIWDSLPKQQYLSLAPWTWVQLESADPPGPFPFIAGVAPEVVASLHEAHGLFASAIDTAISDVLSKRAPLDDPDRQRRLEDAYAEVISARPHCSGIFVVGEGRTVHFNGNLLPIPPILPLSPTTGSGFSIL